MLRCIHTFQSSFLPLPLSHDDVLEANLILHPFPSHLVIQPQSHQPIKYTSATRRSTYPLNETSLLFSSPDPSPTTTTIHCSRSYVIHKQWVADRSFVRSFVLRLRLIISIAITRYCSIMQTTYLLLCVPQRRRLLLLCASSIRGYLSSPDNLCESYHSLCVCGCLYFMGDTEEEVEEEKTKKKEKNLQSTK